MQMDRPVWDLQRLRQRRSRDLVRITELVATKGAFLEALVYSMTLEQRRFKDLTNRGTLRRHGRDFDPGNYAMCVVYELAVPRLDELLPGLLPSLRERWPALHHPAGGPLSKHAIEQRGGMIEFALYMARHTGPAVPVESRRARLAFNDALRVFVLDSFQNMMIALNCEYVRVADRPCPAELAALIHERPRA